MSRRRAAAVLASMALVAAGCGGGVATPASSSAPSVDDVRRSIAAEYAESAERALVGTRYEALGPDGIMDLVLDACARLDPTSPEAAVDGAIAALGLDAPRDAADDRIAVEVVAEGMATVCPADVLRASGVDPSVQEGDVTTLFLGAVAPFAESSGFSFLDEELVAAGEAVCGRLRAGESPEAAILEGLSVLFDVAVASLDELPDARDEGLLLGAVLGAASVYLCPAEAERVAVFIQEGGFG